MHLSIFDCENLVVAIQTMENLVEMITIGIRDEYLTEAITRNQLHYRLNTLGIKLIKDIIEQEKRRCVGTGSLQETKLSQLQGNDEALVLSLTSSRFI